MIRDAEQGSEVETIAKLWLSVAAYSADGVESILGEADHPLVVLPLITSAASRKYFAPHFKFFMISGRLCPYEAMTRKAEVR